VSLCVHLLPSSQLELSALLGFEQTPVAESHTPTPWHWSLALHVTALPDWHTPAWHVSLCVHLSPSSQLELSVFLGLEQAPVEVSQVPAVWHWSLALHVTALLPVHTPA
jgi:hypothetical protein